MKYHRAISDKLNSNISKIPVFENITIDIGTIKNGQPQEIRFKYTNHSINPLIITDVKTSCGCTMPQWDKNPLDINKSSELTIRFTPDSPGRNSKTIMVFHNQSKEPVKLFFKANVE
ncbi:MAG: DUF1573 domain-containing protein [Tannerella sp.]|nr:DUF1573 domain-containing protein [Tannerella sp.]